MNRVIFTFLILPLISDFAAAPPPGAQSTCRLKEADAPDIRGIRLGLSAADLLALFPGSADKKEIKDALATGAASGANEMVTVSFQPALYPSRDRFARIDSISASLYKGRLVAFNVVYIGPATNGPTWRNVDEWIAKLSEAFSLPGARQWAAGSGENPSKFLKCDGVEVEAVVAAGTGAISVRNTSSMKSEQESAAEQEKKRREFKP
jgi:hypothetical protein